MSSKKNAKSIVTLDIKRFHLKNIRPPSNVLIIGPQASGKTTIINCFLRNIRMRGKGIVSTTEIDNYDYLDERYWTIQYGDDTLQRSEMTEKERNNIRKCDVRVFEDEVVDECFQIFYDRRAFNIIALQNYQKISSRIKNNIDYLILLNGIKDIRKVWFDYVGIIPKYRQFKKIYDSCTDNYEFLLVDFTGHSRKMQDHIFWGSADWKFGEFGKKETPQSFGLEKKKIEFQDITSNISRQFIMNEVHEAETVEIPKQKPPKSTTIETNLQKIIPTPIKSKTPTMVVTKSIETETKTIDVVPRDVENPIQQPSPNTFLNSENRVPVIINVPNTIDVGPLIKSEKGEEEGEEGDCIIL